MTVDQFRATLDSANYGSLIAPLLRDDTTPFVFEPKPARWPQFRDDIASRLGASAVDIRIVGSGRFGYSTAPFKNFKQFNDRSDIDLVVVDAKLFDDMWHSLLRAVYPRREAGRRFGGWLADRKSEVYTGWLTPLAIRPDYSIYGPAARKVLKLREQWFITFKQMSMVPPRRHSEIKGRLYRTWAHAEMYHLDSLEALRESLSEGTA